MSAAPRPGTPEGDTAGRFSALCTVLNWTWEETVQEVQRIGAEVEAYVAQRERAEIPPGMAELEWARAYFGMVDEDVAGNGRLPYSIPEALANENGIGYAVGWLRWLGQWFAAQASASSSLLAWFNTIKELAPRRAIDA